jgi:hypothetical protein
LRFPVPEFRGDVESGRERFIGVLKAEFAENRGFSLVISSGGNQIE